MRPQVQRTSIEAYREIRGTKLNKAQSDVLCALREAKRPVTGREIAVYKEIDGAWKRLPELERAGRAVRVGTRRCSVSKKNATAWSAF
jgi:hypothetical protein